MVVCCIGEELCWKPLLSPKCLWLILLCITPDVTNITTSTTASAADSVRWLFIINEDVPCILFHVIIFYIAETKKIRRNYYEQLIYHLIKDKCLPLVRLLSMYKGPKLRAACALPSCTHLIESVLMFLCTVLPSSASERFS